MKLSRICLFISFALLVTNVANSQLIPDPDLDEDLLRKHWDASWVRVPGSDPYGYGVYFFRNTIQLDHAPGEFIIHVSADNRYKLFVNGNWIGLGPARSDPDHWKFETYDLAPWLNEGQNTISLTVWNFGILKPWAQLSLYTALVVQGNGQGEAQLNTPGTWRCKQTDAIQPVQDDTREMGQFIIVGARDHIKGKHYPWGWESNGFDDSDWTEPEVILPAAPRGVGTDITHALVPRRLPAMELTPVQPPVIRKTLKGEYLPSAKEGRSIHEITIPSNSRTTLLLDQEKLINGYPGLTVSGGNGGSIRLRYDEALFDNEGNKKHRDSIDGLYSRGYFDEIIPDGHRRTYTTLWFRTFRYITIDVETANEPLVIHDLTTLFTGYPFTEKASFESSDPTLREIWNTGWHTSRLCANELFYDCPYYEQMQYVGDTRIQALISLYVSGDDRLMRKAIEDFYHSMTPEGLTQSRYPSEPRQIIPTYSLFWISMLHDYLLHRPDYTFTAEYLTSIQHIVRWFENRVDEETGMLGPLEWWPFVDWTDEWPWDNELRIGGVPPGGQTGNSSIITLQFAMTLQQAADIFSFYGLDELAAGYLDLAERLIGSTRELCWNNEREFFADTPDMTSFSQHANTLGILTGAVPKEDQALLMDRVLNDMSLVQASFYFRFYVLRAMIEAGLGNKYLEALDPWKKMIGYGLTTFVEIADLERTRSDCHAWSSSPLYELLATVAGIRPAETGFRQIFIEPHPGNLEWLKATMPHPNGEIMVDLRFRNGTVRGEVTLPPGTPGLFIWRGRTMDLGPGKQKISLRDPDF